MAERCLELMVARVTTRTAFGKLLAHQGSILQDIALSRTEIEQARLLTMKAAHMYLSSYRNKREKELQLIISTGWIPWEIRRPGITLP